MPDIAEIGFKADSSDLVAAKQNLEALGPAADKATGASAKFNAMLDAVTKASNGLTSSAASLVKASDQLTASLARGSTATTSAKTATDGLATSTQRVSVTFTTTAAAVNTAAKATDDATRAARDNTTATQAQAAAQDRLADSIARPATRIGTPGAALPQAANFGAKAQGAADEAAAFSASVAAANATKSIETETVKAEGLFARFRKAGLNAYDGIRDAAAVGGRGLFGSGGASTIVKEAEAVEKVGASAHASSFQLMEVGRIAKDLATGNYAMLERSGFTLASSFKVVQSAMLPLLAVAATVFAGLKITQHEYNTELEQNSLTKYAQDLGLTEKEMRKLKDTTVDADGQLKSHNDLQITMGDTIKGVFKTIVDAGKDAVGGDLFAKIQESGSKTFGDLGAKAKTFGIDLLASLIFARNALTDIGEYVHAKMMAAFGDMIGVIGTALQNTINTIIHGFNAVGSYLNTLLHTDVFGKAEDVAFAKVKTAAQYTDQAAAAAKRLGGEWKNARSEAEKGVASIGSNLGKNIDNAARTRIKGVADAIKNNRNPPRASNRSPSTSLDPFDSIVNSADNDISKTQAAIAGVNLTADAKARLANEQKLLNEADSKGLTLTAAQRAQLIGLADKLSDLQVQLKNLEGFKAITDGADRTLATLKSEHDAIGLIGDAALVYKYRTDLLNEAKSKNITLTDEQTASIERQARALAVQAATNTRDKYFNDASTGATARLSTLQDEQSALGLNADQALRLKNEQTLLNDATAKHIQLLPSQIASLKKTANATSDTEIAIRNTKDALDLAKDSTKSFVSDLRSSLAQGQGFFAAFGNAVVNVLNKVLDKLLDLAINSAFGGSNSGGGIGGLLSGLGIGGGSAKLTNNVNSLSDSLVTAGNATAIGFAKGGTFTNQVVTQRTPFSFAKGTALGEMGEAGPEAIMPLTRGADGSLGVAAHGGGGSSAPNVTFVQGDNHYTIAGAIDQGTISAQIRATAEQTKQESKKAVVGWLNEFQQNGAISG